MKQPHDEIPFSMPWIGRAEIREVVRVLKRGWLTSGPACEEFEAAVRKRLGCAVAVATSSATTALEVSLAVLGIGPGDEVILPAYTFTATAAVVMHRGARPVLCDVDAGTFNLDPQAVEALIAREYLLREGTLVSRSRGGILRALMPVHFGGQPADMTKLNAIAWRHGLAVVEDAAHALGAEDNGRRVGSGPNLTVFSFYSNKNLTTGEGGMVVTDRRELAPPLRRWALHGLSKDNRARYQAGSPLYDVLFPGLKANLPDVLAALGIAQMGRIEQILARRRRVAGWYDRLLRNEAGLIRPRVREGCRPTWHLYPVLLSEGGQERRDRIIARLLEQGIHPSVHFIPLPRFTFWKETFGDPPGDFPVSERLFAREISLPIFPTMTLAQVRRVTEALSRALAETI